MTLTNIIARSAIFQKRPIPLFSTRVAAGFPSPADDYVERTLDLNELCISNPPATYFVRADGESMINAGISPGDLLVVDRSIKPEPEDIIIAALDGEFTVKYLQTKPVVCLVPANDNYQPINVSPDQDLTVFGVVTNVIKQLRKCRSR